MRCGGCSKVISPWKSNPFSRLCPECSKAAKIEAARRRVVEQVDRLIDALKNDQEHLRWDAAVSLGKLGSRSVAAVPELTNALNDRNGGVRKAAEEALAAIAIAQEQEGKPLEPQAMLPHRGSLIFVLGLLSLILCPLALGISLVLAVIARTMGVRDLQAIEEGRMIAAGKAETRKGITLANTSIILHICILVTVVILVIAIRLGVR